jgi:hypothetical protein
MAAVGPLIGARKAADLAALGATCRQLRSFIAAIPLYKHYKLFNNSLKSIKNINILSNKYVSIREHYDGLHIYIYTSVWLNSIGYKSVERYIMLSVKKHKYYRIEHWNKIKISDRVILDDKFIINIEGSIPTWISKYKNLLISKYSINKWTFHV